MAPSPAHVLLEAVKFAVQGDVRALRQLAGTNHSLLKLDLILRILLTYLPESIEPRAYTAFLQDLVSGDLSALDEPSSPLRPPKDISDEEAYRRVNKLRLRSLAVPPEYAVQPHDDLSRFLLIKAHQIDEETGSLPLVQQLVKPFVEHSEAIRTWVVSTLLPLLRLEYEYYPGDEPAISISELERMHGLSGVSTLLAKTFSRNRTAHTPEPGRDLRGLVGPWIYGESRNKRRKIRDQDIGDLVPEKPESSVDNTQPHLIEAWGHVNDWIVELAKQDFSKAITVVEQWDGPRDIDYGGWLDATSGDEEQLAKSTIAYSQSALATVYLSQDNAITTVEQIQNGLARVSRLSGLLPPPSFSDFRALPPTSAVNSEYLNSIAAVHLLRGELSDPANPLTVPNSQSLELASLLLISANLLRILGQQLSVDRVLSLGLLGSGSDQYTVFRKILHAVPSSVDDTNWAEIRDQLLWLRNWQGGDTPCHGIFARIKSSEFEIEILKALVASNRFKLAKDIYCREEFDILPSEQVEESILDVILQSYDNASNGNRTRGGVKKAADIIKAFEADFPHSSSFKRTSALLLATHLLSFYSLVLQHGVPFLPVNIRAHPNPLTLIEKVLAQNPGSYTKLDDLLDIGRSLVRAGLIKPGSTDRPLSEQAQVLDVERRIVAKAIEASLAEDDFDTAYSYVVSRLPSLEPAEDRSIAGDDILWRAAYQAGHFQPKNDAGPSALRRNEQKMELLSQALLLAPPAFLREVLSAWRKCEDATNAALAREAEEEDAWNDKADRTVPGGFTMDDIVPVKQNPREPTRNALSEEAPVNLFDVARGAAAALGKSAFPLRELKMREMNSAEGPSPARSNFSEEDGEGRVRKRDMVSNALTGGLVRGVGWVLGAPAARE